MKFEDVAAVVRLRLIWGSNCQAHFRFAPTDVGGYAGQVAAVVRLR